MNLYCPQSYIIHATHGFQCYFETQSAAEGEWFKRAAVIAQNLRQL